MNNQKLVLVSVILTVLATGLLALSPSINAQAQTYNYDNQYVYDDNNYNNNYYSDSKSSHVEVQKISCVNVNKNINGLDVTEIPEDSTSTATANEQAGAANAQNGKGLADKINFNKNLVNICVNVNVNNQVKVDTSPQLPETCEGCFSVLSDQEKTTVIFYANEVFQVETIHSILDLCDFLQTSTLPKTTLGSNMAQILDNAGISIQDKDFILGCLEHLGLILGPT